VCVLRPVWVPRLVCQVEDVAGDVALRGEVGHDPRLVGSGHLQATYGAVTALPAPKGRETGGERERESIRYLSFISWDFINSSIGIIVVLVFVVLVFVVFVVVVFVVVFVVVSPFVDALLAEAVSAGQDEVSLPVHADAALLFVGQLLHSAHEGEGGGEALWIE